MFPALQHGDLLLVNLYVYHFSEPGRGDIAVFKNNNILFVKRIIGLPGDTVEVIEHRAIVNGVLLEEQYLQFSEISKAWPVFVQAPSSYGPVKVPSGSYFFLGDNRPQSMDSRRWGVISKDSSIVGRVDAVWLPWGRVNKMGKI